MAYLITYCLMDVNNQAFAKIHQLVYGDRPRTPQSILQEYYARDLYLKYRKGTWGDKVYRAVFHACPD